ncbi:MAG: DNA polymerase III subunit delta, partial [Bacteroidaceae bacterium]|nr:DNA polymerase III subunit delta [Bacteroidaceae bacterium]
MTFIDIIGQKDVKARLMEGCRNGKVPHALMLCGPEGCGAMPIAIGYARNLLCKQKTEDGEACGHCNACIMADKLQHPDLHFVFPIYKKHGSSKPTYCDDFIKEWRELNINTPYFGMAEWMEASGAENQQLIIYGDESDAVSRKLSLKASQGGYKVVIMWLPEKMNEACANKLLKLLEEPPAQTVFILVCERPDLVLQTIRSRTQMIDVPSLDLADMEAALVERMGILPAEAKRIARSTNGNMAAALRYISDDSESARFFNLFVSLMRLSYMRKVKEMKQWSEEVASLGRERQKNFLDYCQKMVRENFIYNFNKHDDLNYMNEREAEFAVKFAPFINENNVIGLMEELSLAQRDIAQNANAKIVFFDFALKMIVLIK